MSDGVVERAGVDLVHFTIQSAFLTDIPSIYHPHDLQHLHLSRYFSPREIATRELNYRTYCDRAQMVAVTSRWAREDLIRQYGLPGEKVVVVPWAPITDEYPVPRPGDLDRVRLEHRLPDRFILYPAQTWPHKNHAGLLEALALLRHRGDVVSLVSTGYLNTHAKVLQGQARRYWGSPATSSGLAPWIPLPSGRSTRWRRRWWYRRGSRRRAGPCGRRSRLVSR